MSDTTLKLWMNGCEWVVAVDPADASKCFEESTGEKASDYDHEWREDTRSSITVKDEDGPDETHSAAEWVALKGRGYLWCTEN